MSDPVPLTPEELDALEEMADTVGVKGKLLRQLIHEVRQSRQGWIPVSEKLPESSGHYLVNYGPAASSFYGIGGGIEFYAVEKTTNGQIGWFDGPEMVTHWHPLPAPPDKE